VLTLVGLAAGIAVALAGNDGKSGSSEPRGTLAARGPTAPGRDPRTIVPGRSIGAVALGMKESDVEDLYGQGSEQLWRSAGRNGTRVTFPAPGGALSVSFYDGTVVQIATTSAYYRTEDGIDVGSLPPYPATSERKAAALRSGALEEIRPGVYAWRDFVYESHGSYCLRGEKAATQLIQKPIGVRIASVIITDARFLPYLPAHLDPNPYTGGEDFFCAERPLGD
jgi:hypothetical protein